MLPGGWIRGCNDKLSATQADGRQHCDGMQAIWPNCILILSVLAHVQLY